MRSTAALLCLLVPLAACAAPKVLATRPAPPAQVGAAPSAPAAALPSAAEAATVNEQGDAEVTLAPSLKEPLRLYAARDFAGAALAFNAVIEAPAPPGSAPREDLKAAPFFLAKALEHMGYRVASIALFDEISADAAHPYRARTLPWLVRLADELPDDDPVLRAIGRFTLGDIDHAAPPQPDALRDSARYYIGRANYTRKRFDEAMAALRGVPARSRWSLQARFFEGVSRLRAEDNDAAIDIFRSVAVSAEKAEAAGNGPPDAARLRDLAWLSLARVHYSSAGHDSDGAELLAGSEMLRQSLEAYARVTERGGYHDDALLEQAWALLRLADFKRALESLDELSPEFLETTPEAHYLRALIYFSRCDLDKAAAAVDALRRDYGVRADHVERLGRASTDELLREGGGRGLSPHMPAVVTSALAQRDVKRRFELLGVIKAERELLAAVPPSLGLQSSPLGARIAASLKAAEDAASAKITELVRARCDRFVTESRGEIEKADRVDIEIQSIRGGASKCTPRK